MIQPNPQTLKQLVLVTSARADSPKCPYFGNVLSTLVASQQLVTYQIFTN